jgi:diguanylate cyclase (GGDEF)-like protein
MRYSHQTSGRSRHWQDSTTADVFMPLLRQIAPLRQTARCVDAIDRFTALPSLQMLAVVDDIERLIGVVHRTNLVSTLDPRLPPGSWSEASIDHVATSDCLTLDLGHSLNEVADKLLDFDDRHGLIDIPVTDQGHYIGLISLSAILRQILERDRNDLYNLAYFDPLTGLPNRVLFQDRLKQACRTTLRSQFCFALAFVDLDEFKQVNDNHGHHVGDRLLQTVAQHLKSSVRESDTVARLAGDEFVLIVGGVRDGSDVGRVCNNIQAKLSGINEGSEGDLGTSVSIGIALCPMDDTTPEGLLAKADAAMYEAKNRGRNRYAFYSETHAGTSNAQQPLTSQIAKAVERNELTLVYQPVFCLDTRQIVSVEALLRWQHPELGLMTPTTFLGAAQSAGAMNRIGTWVLSAACTQQKRWADHGLPSFRVSVNLSPEQYRSPGFCSTVEHVIRETGMEPDFLELEATEKMLSDETEQGLTNLAKLQQKGIAITVDDFGLGLCRWNDLRKLPVSQLKLDGSIIRNIHASRTGIALLSNISLMAQRLKLKLVAEAVESEAEADCLRSHRCDDAQGHVFGRPLTAEQFESWYRHSRPGYAS